MVMLGSVYLVIKREQEFSKGSVSTPNSPLKIPYIFPWMLQEVKAFPLGP